MSFDTDAVACSTYWELQSEGGEILDRGNVEITEAQFKAYAKDNVFIENIVLKELLLTRKL
jgi:hypothetical protein